ncbi:MAG: amidohydrolase family protein [Acidimicrobiales bacterium]
MVEYCSASPARLYGVGVVPLQSIDLAVAEVQRVHDIGLKGVFVRPSAYIDDLPLSHSVYDPFWALCQSLGLPVAFHPGVHVDTPGACRRLDLVRVHPNLTVVNSAVDETHGGSGFGQAIGNAVDMIATMGRLLMGGVCERFPDLRCIFLESAGGWCATMLDRMDEQAEAFSLERSWLTLKPSEYFRRQCYISFEPEEWNLAASAERLGTDRVIWASDYPHPEYHPGVVDDVRESIAALDEADQARILGGNAVSAYRLPVPVR